MTLEQLGNVGEFGAAVATLITLVYLAIQVRQNTKAMEWWNDAKITFHQQFVEYVDRRLGGDDILERHPSMGVGGE